MFRPAVRQVLRGARPQASTRTTQSKRFISTGPSYSRGWKSSAVRWGLAGTLVYYYNTASVFADEPTYTVHAPPETRHESETLPTLEEVAAKRVANRQPTETVVDTTPANAAEVAAPGSPDELEEEASQQGAFNEETGEINWDCPCLGGMAHGPCGEEFRSAFSCFVYSKEEPKGVDCIDKFKGMQDCFRQHPEIYGAELDDEEDAAATGEPMPASAGEQEPGLVASSVETSATEQPYLPVESKTDATSPKGDKVSGSADSPAVVQGKRERSQAAREQVATQHSEPTSESSELVPKAWHDSTDENSKGDK